MLRWLPSLMLLLVLFAPIAMAQDPLPEDPVTAAEDEVFNVVEVYELVALEPFVTLPVNGQVTATLLFRDLSRDSGTGAGGGVVTAGTGQQHRGSVSVTPVEAKPGWLAAASVVGFTTTGGDEKEIPIIVQVDPLADDPYYQFEVSVRVRDQVGYESTVATTVQAYTPGLDAFNAQVTELAKVKPREIKEINVRISNSVALLPRAFDMEVVGNPCGFEVATTSNNVVQAGTTDEFPISLLTPADKIWYPSESCLITLEVYPSDNPAKVRTVVIVATINGWYIDPGVLYRIPFIAAAIFIVAIIIKRRKERIEEEILGKPQKPWTIPSESLYLAELKKRDPRAAYVVRNYLMEDEYKSALLWYKSYKKATKGSRAKERLIVGAEHKFENWQDVWAKKAMKPEMKADAYEQKLQRGLDRQARKEHNQALKKWAKQCKKLDAAHEKTVAREDARWQRAAKKAEKKGLDVPARPDLGDAEHPPEPARREIPLVSHDWQAKADKFRLKMEKEEDKIRAQFEARRGRHLRKLARNVKVLVRKLDDETFIDEHPLLIEAMAA